MLNTSGLRQRQLTSARQDTQDVASTSSSSSRPTQASLPQGWESKFDSQAGEENFFHTNSQHFQKNRPAPLIPGWEEATYTKGEKIGQLYYYNRITKQERSASERPDSSTSQLKLIQAPTIQNVEKTIIAGNQTTFPGPGRSWGCERRGGAIKGSSKDLIKNDDIEGICMRLLQSRDTSRVYTGLAIGETFFTIVHLARLLTLDGTMAQTATRATFALGGALAVPPHAGLTIQYSSVNQDCEDYLIECFDEKFVDDLKKVAFNKKGINEIIQLLTDYNSEIKTPQLEAQIKKFEEDSNQNILSQLVTYIKEKLYPQVKFGQ